MFLESSEFCSRQRKMRKFSQTLCGCWEWREEAGVRSGAEAAAETEHESFTSMAGKQHITIRGKAMKPERPAVVSGFKAFPLMVICDSSAQQWSRHRCVNVFP